MRFPVLLVLASLMSTVISTAQQLPRQGDFSWHGPVARGSFVEIRGINGDVRATPSISGEVEVVATIDGAETASPVEVRMMRHQNGVTVCAVFPADKVCREQGVAGPGARVNFEVRVPEGVHFLGSTVNGGVEAESLKGDVQAYTVNGRVRVSTTGTVQAKTVNGSITAALLKPFWSKPPELKTVNGGIRLVLPPSANAALRAATKNGRILTDFEARGKVTDQEVVAQIGGGGSALILNTVNGSIELKRGA